ncbi:amino acid decarboxylase [Baekduia soli]|uniref:Amino acid decarboxylase n=1 Tax=Baekduia soli TaxID=496014 RepID=A0A5B8U481_9ACTN|nr:aminotransferase class I/II-fold pyridoxal phosphate-dependent enzyme [Baekduia soli]QEC47751.1 amino acid decarboxylase [Baekduia soli]
MSEARTPDPGPSEQPTAPYLDAVVGYGFRGSGRFHVPGHKGGPGADPGLRHAIGDDALLLDIPQDIHGVDVGPSPTPYERAEALAAEAYGATRTWFLTNGATQGNHALCLALAPLGAHVVAQRNSHASVVDGLVLSGGRPSFVAPAYDEELGMAHGVEPDALDAALTADPEARVAFLVSPTYYGMVADVAALAEVAHRHDVALVVDQSWGPHFGFHPDLPQSALRLGADAVLTSTHKIIGSLTQSAMLHVGNGVDPPRIDPGAVGRAIRLVRSTSPSSLLMASLDAARRQIAVHGEALLHETLDAAAATRAKLATTPGIVTIAEDFVGHPGVAGYDPLRLVLDTRGTGCTGYEVADALRNAYDVQPELATVATMVCVLGMGQPTDALVRLAGDIDEIVKRISRPGTVEALVRGPTALHNEMVVIPRDAFLGRSEVVPVDAAVGRISCESIAGYPPGIPALLPGERITAGTVAYLRELVASGARLHGAADPTLATIHVLAG